MQTLEDMRRYVTDAVADIGRGFTRPDDDWMMVMFVQTPEGIAILPLENEWFANGITKDLLGEILKHVVSESGAIRYAILLNTFALEVDPTDDMGEDDMKFMEQVLQENIRLSAHPRSKEILWLLLGDAEGEQEWTAEIVRRRNGKPPTLRRWERKPEEAVSTGRFTGLNQYL